MELVSRVQNFDVIIYVSFQATVNGKDMNKLNRHELVKLVYSDQLV